MREEKTDSDGAEEWVEMGDLIMLRWAKSEGMCAWSSESDWRASVIKVCWYLCYMWKKLWSNFVYVILIGSTINLPLGAKNSLKTTMWFHHLLGNSIPCQEWQKMHRYGSVSRHLQQVLVTSVKSDFRSVIDFSWEPASVLFCYHY